MFLKKTVYVSILVRSLKEASLFCHHGEPTQPARGGFMANRRAEEPGMEAISAKPFQPDQVFFR